MTSDDQRPALLLGWLTPCYDAFAKLFLREQQVKSDLVIHARIAPGSRVLDLGAGSGTLAIMVRRAQPNVSVVGLDADAGIVGIAREKANHAGVEIDFNLGSVAALPYADESFDRVLSSLVFSLLSHEDKQRTAREAYRVLGRGGGLYLADFGPPHTRWGRLLAPRMRRFTPIADNLDGLIPGILRTAGFEPVSEVARTATMLGTLSVLHGRKPR